MKLFYRHSILNYISKDILLIEVYYCHYYFFYRVNGLPIATWGEFRSVPTRLEYIRMKYKPLQPDPNLSRKIIPTPIRCKDLMPISLQDKLSFYIDIFKIAIINKTNSIINYLFFINLTC